METTVSHRWELAHEWKPDEGQEQDEGLDVLLHRAHVQPVGTELDVEKDGSAANEKKPEVLQMEKRRKCCKCEKNGSAANGKEQFCCLWHSQIERVRLNLYK